MAQSIIDKTSEAPTYSKYSSYHLADIPPYLDFQLSDDAEEVYIMREHVLLGLACSTAITHRENNVITKFYQLTSEIEEDCRMVSIAAHVFIHPSYQRIIGMGEKIIPLLINQLDKTPNLWFNALEAITGMNPVPKKDRGVVMKEIKHWKKWAIENDYA